MECWSNGKEFKNEAKNHERLLASLRFALLLLS